MEKNLLIIGLIKFGDKKTAESIAGVIDLKAKSIFTDTNYRKKLFDTVISAKAKSGAE